MKKSTNTIGHKNLIPLNKRSPDDVKKITSAGGIASGKSKQNKKTFRETLEQLLAETITAKDGAKMTRLDAMSLAQIVKAINKGDTKAFIAVRDSIGEKPIEQIEVINELTAEQAEDMRNKALNVINKDNQKVE